MPTRSIARNRPRQTDVSPESIDVGAINRLLAIKGVPDSFLDSSLKSGGQASGFACYHKFFVVWDNQNREARIGIVYSAVTVSAVMLVLIGINIKPQKPQVTQRFLPYPAAVFSDATREYKRIQVAQRSHHGAHVLGKAKAEYLNGKSRRFMALVGQLA